MTPLCPDDLLSAVAAMLAEPDEDLNDAEALEHESQANDKRRRITTRPSKGDGR